MKPIGYVSTNLEEPIDVPIHGQTAIITIEEQYLKALTRIELNSHLWILSWFHKAKRNVLMSTPLRINPNLPPFGIFGLRSPNRPNPIALSLVRLVKVDGNKLYVENFDAINGTPILDIKPYFEKDIIFSPKTPDIRPVHKDMKINWFKAEAQNHHQEYCEGLAIGVRMAFIADKHFGKITNPDVTLDVQGSYCFIDVLQGLTKARFANPARLTVAYDETLWTSTWRNGDKMLTITFDPALFDKYSMKYVEAMEDDEIFAIKTYSEVTN